MPKTLTPLKLDTVVSVSREQSTADLGDEAVILGLAKSQYFGLDGVGARIWQILHEPRTVAEVRDLLLEEYEVEAECCERDLLVLLEELRGEGLLRVTAQADSDNLPG